MVGAPAGGTGRGAKARARFAPGEAVWVPARAVLGHCRTPFYVRGKRGVVTGVHGSFRDPERLAYHRPGLPAQVLYKVRFKQSDLWQAYRGSDEDHLEVDIYEHWLEPAG